MLRKVSKNFRFGIAIFSIVFLSIFASSLSWGNTWLTVCGGRSIIHDHFAEQYSYDYKIYLNNIIINNFPCIINCFDLPTTTYNCHGWAYNHLSTGYGSEVVNKIWPDDFVTVSWPFQLGDRVGYYKYGQITHSGVVSGVSSGNITSIDSKWGWTGGLYRHPPACVPSDYGTIAYVKRFIGCERGSSNYEYSPEALNPIMITEEKFAELVGGDPHDEFGRAKRAKQVDEWLESFKKGEINLNQVINYLTSGFEDPMSMNSVEFGLASEPAVAKLFFQEMPEIQGLIALGDQAIKPLTDKINDQNLENKFVAIPAYNYVLEVLNEKNKD